MTNKSLSPKLAQKKCSLAELPNVPAGTITFNTDELCLQNEYGVKLKLKGVSPRDSNTRHDKEGIKTYETLIHLHALEGEYPMGKEKKYTIEWVLNWPTELHWPHSAKSETTITKTKVLDDANGKTMMKDESNSYVFSRNCLRFNLDGHDVVIGGSFSEEASNDKNPGFILYQGVPSEDFRDKLRRCLSFFLGAYLVCLGCTYFDEEWHPVGFKAISSYDYYGRIYEVSGSPPSSLSPGTRNMVDPIIFPAMVSKLYNLYDALDFTRLSWAYWHAAIATPHTAAGQFGAAIESLMELSCALMPEAVPKGVLADAAWINLKKELSAVLMAAEAIDPQDYKVLESRIGTLNNLPPNMKSEMLFGSLGLKLGKAERQAWQRRNDTSHGNKMKDGDEIPLIKDIKLLRIRFNRLLLGVTKASDTYYDYYTLGHPLRYLTDEIE